MTSRLIVIFVAKLLDKTYWDFSRYKYWTSAGITQVMRVPAVG